MKPKKWTDVYPHGTKEGDEELKFFISLARNPKYQWRSVSAIAKETNLTRERVEQIIDKYFKKGMIFQNPKNEDQWGYWERVPEMLPKATPSIGKKDQDDRIRKACSKDSNDLDFDLTDCDDKCDHGLCLKTKSGHTFEMNDEAHQNVIHLHNKRHLLEQIKMMYRNNQRNKKEEKCVFFNDGKNSYKVPEWRAAEILNKKKSGWSKSEAFIERMKEGLNAEYWIPQKLEGSANKFDMVTFHAVEKPVNPDCAIKKQEAEDLAYFKNKLFNALKMPEIPEGFKS